MSLEVSLERSNRGSVDNFSWDGIPQLRGCGGEAPITSTSAVSRYFQQGPRGTPEVIPRRMPNDQHAR